MKLLIAEKPSLGRAISEFVGIIERKEGYIVCKNDYVISWVFGHLLELCYPSDYGDEYKSWHFDQLPFYPDVFKTSIIEGKEKQYKIIKDLLQKANKVINAGDPGREGQLLVDELLIHMNNNKPVERILLAALDNDSMKKAFANIQDNSKFKNIYESAIARQYADYLVGINLTRAFTLYGKDKKIFKDTFNIGRVQTPTLKLICDRFFANKDFKKATYYELVFEMQKSGQKFFAKYIPVEDNLSEHGYLIDKTILENICSKLNTLKVSDFKEKIGVENPPLLFSLSALQIQANKKLNFSATKTLEIVQSLYEKKVVTYPRTDCNYLPHSMFEERYTILQNLIPLFSEPLKEINRDTKSKSFNDEKITEHHAIVPTRKIIPEDLSSDEKEIYNLIAFQYVLQFLPNAEFLERAAILKSEDDVYCFFSKSKMYQNLGFKKWLGEIKEDEEEDEKRNSDLNIPVLRIGELLNVKDKVILEKQTTPPKLYTEATLISAMVSAHNLIKNDDALNEEEKEKFKHLLKEAKGMGTEATRAGIIENLKKNDFITLKGKSLIPTEKGIQAVNIFKLPVINENFAFISKPSATAFFEQKLDAIANGSFTREAFLSLIKQRLDKIVILKEDKNVGDYSKFGIKPMSRDQNNPECPLCGKGKVCKGKKGNYFCNRFSDEPDKCAFVLFPMVAGKKLTDKMIEMLIAKKTTNLVKGFKSKEGKEFEAKLKYDPEKNRVQFVFDKPKGK